MKARILPAQCALISIVLLLTALTPALATRAIPTRLEDLMANSQWCLRGRVTATRVVVADGARRISTLVTFGVTDVIGGDGIPPSFTVEVPGGIVGDKARIAVGIPLFQVGDDYFLLVNTSRLAGKPMVTNLLNGLFPVVVDARGAPVVPNNLRRRGVTDAPPESEISSFTPGELRQLLFQEWQRAKGGGQ